VEHFVALPLAAAGMIIIKTWLKAHEDRVMSRKLKPDSGKNRNPSKRTIISNDYSVNAG
jgi:hypothetical protein